MLNVCAHTREAGLQHYSTHPFLPGTMQVPPAPQVRNIAKINEDNV